VSVLSLTNRSSSHKLVIKSSTADNFVQKPFHFEVLIAKIQAVLRRVYNYNAEPPALKTWLGATIDYERNRVQHNEQTIELTKNEMFILKLLVERKNKIVSREDLITSLWEDERFVSDNTLTVNVNRLRKKLSDLGLGGSIHTKVGQGYTAIEKAES
jgi:OmpR family two-component system bacitracin resistance response regulator BceR